MDDEYVEEVRESIRGKCGVELFKELLRHNPAAHHEDYYRNYVWDDTVLRLDIEILACHRREAGAPDPIPLSEVMMPYLPMPPQPPKAPSFVVGPRPSSLGVPGMIMRPPGVPTVMPPPGQVMSKSMAVPTPPEVVQAPGPQIVTPIPGAPGSATADLRSIALFVSKWKLEPARTKLLMTKLPPERRTFIMKNFKYATVNGVSPIAKLEEYITECDNTNAWANAAVVGVPPPASLPSPEPVAAGEAASDLMPPAKKLNTGVTVAPPVSKSAAVVAPPTVVPPPATPVLVRP
eukprot:TRINITY_DN21980_c0_g1_i1.p2 TRINITY_DN21980_c0_g1~~TRINITY_DN21980_c0_g1_i1.p2  ORF type:complete len:291 (-),score=57.39 TRINITY_DN21980_c0_g1_i1:237-1109(-)